MDALACRCPMSGRSDEDRERVRIMIAVRMRGHGDPLPLGAIPLYLRMYGYPNDRRLRLAFAAALRGERRLHYNTPALPSDYADREVGLAQIPALAGRQLPQGWHREMREALLERKRQARQHPTAPPPVVASPFRHSNRSYTSSRPPPEYTVGVFTARIVVDVSEIPAQMPDILGEYMREMHQRIPTAPA